MPATEYVVLVDQHDQEQGLAEKLSAHRNNLLHRAFSVFIFRRRPQLELLLQQRALMKYHSEGLWTNTCCSHPRPGEPILAAGERRLQEELGFGALLRYVGRFHYQAAFHDGLYENEIDHVLMGLVDPKTTICPDPREVHGYRWTTPHALQHELTYAPHHFTPWLAQAWDMAKAHLAVLGLI